MRIEVLGPVRLSTDVGVAVDVAERKVRLLLAALVAAGGAPVPAEALVDRVWGENLPANPKRVLRAKLSQLRAALDRARPGARELLAHTPAGYRLAVEPGSVDAGRFRDEVERARRLSAGKRAEVLDRALSMWNGEAYADFADELWLAPVIAELEEARLTAVELLAEALLESGTPERAIERANGVAAAHPTRERLVSALMLALYQAGRQHEALELFEALRHRLAEDVGVDPSPQVRELHGRILRQDPALTGDRPRGRSALARTNVPAETAALIGRRREIDEIAASLTGTRLVTLTGAGGVGKTRLALHLARAQLAQFHRGTWFIDLTELASTPAGERPSVERVADLVMSALDLPSAPADNFAEVCEALGSRPSLLVLDNCEHVVDEVAEFVARLLRRAPGVRVVATSRQPLGLPEEQRYGVAPLAVEAGPDGVSEAAAFFAARARAVDRTFTLEGSTTEVVELCRRLDGLPLALELAASRTNAISVRDLLERLSDRLNLLARPGRGVPRRQQTLRGLIDWSWSLLDETEQAVLRRLAVHPGGLSLEAAEAICADDATGAQVVDALLGLVDRSMVIASASGPTGVRYGLLESIATYAAEKLDEAGERERVAQRHLRYYLDFADRADENLRGPEQRYWLQRLEAERIQLRHASAEAIRQRDGDSAIALALVTFWYRTMSGRQAHLRDDLRTALGLPGKRDDGYATVAALDVCLSLDAGSGRGGERVDAALAMFDDPFARAGIQWYAGASLLTAGIREAGERHIDEALPVLQDRGADWAASVAVCLRDWLVVSTWGDPPRGLPDGRDAGEVLQELGDSYGLSYALAVEHRTAELSGDYARAAAVAEQAYEQSLALHLWSGVSLWLTARAISALRRGDLAGAAESLQESRSLAAELGYTNGSAYADFGESMIARYHGDTGRARELLERWKKAGDAATANLLTRFEDGFLRVAEGRTGEARSVLTELVPAVRRIDGPPTTARMLELAAAVRTPESAVAAAELLGAAEEVRARAAAEPAAPERRDIDRVVRAIGDRLDDQQVTEAIARGRTRDPDEVVSSLSGR
ncbi:winged helix-turn-helix domain-containing protein [Saccharopolyspora indica]|uniref:ATP-binding protein n=1 Tax=Saccharopolyspora indica TaxID=1229659 RepID=UPI0022EA4CE8|nr:BTAD domain-containing putative transcriptional regulator [Saccharopolyspora indica]MDA3648015.1 BTAD domain-containing putative transcriptional regulator [Saccharopolyspora indica]